jgi:hypothetical protein
MRKRLEAMAVDRRAARCPDLPKVPKRRVGGPAPVRGSALTLTIEDGLGVGVRWLTLFYGRLFVAVVDRLLSSLNRNLNLRKVIQW